MKQWITKDTYLLRRVEMAMEMDLSSVGIYMGIDTTSNMRNHNEPVDIQLPEIEEFIDLGAQAAYETDQEVIQLASAVFYSDVHAGFDSGSNTWKNTAQTPGHYYPTKLALVSDHVLVLSTTVYDPANVNNSRIDGASGAATTAEIQNHAIWMGLLVNAPGDYTGPGTGDDRDAVAPMLGESGPYLQEIPQSAMAGDTYNGGPEPGGGYCWVVGKNGVVYGAYQGSDGNWYSGFNGTYP